ncbi:alpha/beta fold hydrolase [Nocardia takedensis]|uniref:alpha/beta fold hydrolase n=1 Tax=Nocardia takedensis TaxID=259390 RepID=UPI0002F67AC4|nr:alpha/beta fold hydrolase [Nocardia takedensis]
MSTRGDVVTGHEADQEATVVFVHGILSGPHTWDQMVKVIHHDESFARRIRTVLFCYDTPPVQWHPLRRIPGLADIANQLRTTLTDTVPTDRPVILVTHSMGGLVVQQYLADRLRAGAQDELAAIAGIVMFACPNEGSLLFHTPRRWTSAIPMLRHRQEAILQPISEQVIANRAEVISRIVHARDTARRIPIWVFAGASDKVVTAQSARSVYPDAFAGVLPGDHSTIIRPTTVRDDSYIALKNRIGLALTSYAHRHTAKSHTRTREGVLDTLRPDLDAFVRITEVQQILDATDHSRVVVIDGMPGTGKTALATRAAHHLADQFPDGRFFIDLNAHTPDQPPTDPIDAISRLLTNLGADPATLPASLPTCQDLWIDRTRELRLLLVLDDAHDIAQITPLLPSGPRCLTLITSRRRITGLDGAATVTVHTLDPDTAVTLFCTLAKRSPTGTDLAAVERIVRLCGLLPLAITLLAGRLAQHPTWTLVGLADDLTDAKNRLAHMDVDDHHRAIKVAFTLSYNDLTPPRQRLFRHLGLHPGPDLEPHAVAALAEIPADTARLELDALYTENLLNETAYGRYRLHDLLREFASMRAEETDSPADRATAIQRLLTYYQNHVPGATTTEFDWLRTERDNLLACIEYAATHNQPQLLITLTQRLSALLLHDGPLASAIELAQRGSTTAAELGDRLAQASALRTLSQLYDLTGDHPAALQAQQHALTLDPTAAISRPTPTPQTH